MSTLPQPTTDAFDDEHLRPHDDDVSVDVRLKWQDRLACDELLRLLIAYHPELPAGVCREPGTHRPLIYHPPEDRLLRELAE